MTETSTNQQLQATGSIRDGFGHALTDMASQNPAIVGLCADLTESVRMEWFAKAYPERFIEVGVAEQNLVGMAAGFALADKIPVAASYAVFNPGRSWDQLRVSVCYSNLNVKIIGGHTGLSVGPDGATHQALEDIALTRVLPNLTVVVPCDEHQAYQATQAILQHRGPCYLRLSRAITPAVTPTNNSFELGKAQLLQPGEDVTIFATGLMVAQALKAAKQLSKQNISVEVINLHTIKPLDRKSIITSVKKTGCCISAEEHQVIGGLGSAIAETLVENFPVPMIRVGVQDTFGESGQGDELFKKYGLTAQNLVQAVTAVLKRKKVSS